MTDPSPGRPGVRACDLRPHPEERAFARVSKDGRESLRCVHPSRRLLRKLLRMRSVSFTGSFAGDDDWERGMLLSIKRAFTTSRCDAPETLLYLPPKEGVGNAGCPMHPRPRV